MAPKKKATKKSFTPEIRAEAMRLIFEENYTAKQAAETIGCSTFSIQQWKAAAKKNGKKSATKVVADTESAEPTVKKVKKTKKASKKGKKVAKKTAQVVSADVAAAKPLISFDEFAQGYWSECEGAADVLCLPPDIAPKAVEYVNNVLRYAYSQFAGK